MVSREQKRENLHEKLQLLRSVTHSHALNKTSIIVDASKYIKDLKQKVEKLNEDIASTSDVGRFGNNNDTLPMVTVETVEKGYLIIVFSEKGSPGLLVSILEAFEDLGLDILDARVSCTEYFRLEAVGGESDQGQSAESVDAQVVRQAVLRAIRNCQETSGRD